MEIKQLPIPALYCCYLLRSTTNKTSQYVGSTPNPRRRLRQHNGLAKGGAHQTSRAHGRPWEIGCLVTGFQSRLAALQFEWAWQHAWKSSHVPEDDRRTQLAKLTVRVDKKSGKESRIWGPKHRQSLVEKLRYLHYVLQAPAFSRWPLTLHFFVEDVYNEWCRWDERSARHIPKTIPISLDFENIKDDSIDVNELPPSGQPAVSTNARLIDRLDVTYRSIKSHIEKSDTLLAGGKPTTCQICDETLKSEHQAILVCPESSCRAATHMSCLANEFLKFEDSGDQVVPVSGKCPGCRTETIWRDLVKEMSLRFRGSKERASLLKKARRQARSAGGVQNRSDDSSSESDDELDPEDEPLYRGWQAADLDTDGAMIMCGAASDESDYGGMIDERPLLKERLEIIIEDSDGDDLQI